MLCLSPLPPLSHIPPPNLQRGRKKKAVTVIKPVLTNRGGGEEEEGRRLRTNGSAPAACTRLSGRARARQRVDLAVRIKLQCKDYSAAAAGRPQLWRPEGPPVWTPSPLSSLKVGREGHFPRVSGGAGAPGCPARLGSATSQTSGIRSIQTARGREEEEGTPRTGGEARPPTGFLGPQNAPPPRVSDPGLCHPRVLGGSSREGIPSPRAAPPTPENPSLQAARQQRVHGSCPSPKQYISQSSGCTTLP